MPTMARNRARRVRLVGPAVTTAVVIGLVGCGAVSEETRQAGTDALCSQIDARSADVRSSADAARLVALTIRDLAPDENARQLAGRVSQSPGELALRGQLADWIDNKCSR
ncbi:hypothetical protein [Protofrankia symbiont of Coriaria ruscifolia]|uniref:Putative secreted protein n=1 Tax=Candidatus Protofrankia californiensis TaxID=1839754 RepID=A0A1C3NXA5_9ACTN|nr:hypothetical protein [Protofrankia symbiont of Coriaria ruscifolia]SBW22115.1 putative secreted protein [Candidatus Protofrankia californiensis]